MRERDLYLLRQNLCENCKKNFCIHKVAKVASLCNLYCSGRKTDRHVRLQGHFGMPH